MSSNIKRLHMLFALAGLFAGEAGCSNSSRGKVGDGGTDTSMDGPADFSGGGGATGGEGGSLDGMGGSITGMAGIVASSGGAGSGGWISSTGGAGGAGGLPATGGTGGAAPLFSCIEAWPARPADSKKAAPLAVEPRILWMKSLPSAVVGDSVARGMAVTGSGVAFAAGNTLLIYDGDGNLTASVPKPQGTQYVSSPVSGLDGSLYFADTVAAYRVDAMGRPIWQKPLGSYQGAGEFVRPSPPALDAAGRLHVSGLDGKLWTFRGEDGQVVSSVSVDKSRSIDRGVGNVMFVDWTGKSAAGPSRRDPRGPFRS